MNRLCWTLVVTVIVLLFMAPQRGLVVEGTSTLSGRVVDMEGNPVPGFGLTLEPMPSESGNITAEIISDSEHQEEITIFVSRTDKMGRFSIHNIRSVKYRLASHTLSEHESTASHEIVSMKVGALTVHQHVPSPFGGIAVVIKPDTHVENVEIKVKSRQHIRGRIVFTDGTPLVSARIMLNVHRRSPDGTGSGSSSSSGKTDADGYFAFHADETAIYTVTVNHQGLSATAEPFLLREGENKGDLVFTFDSEPISPDVPTGRIEVSAEASTSSVPGDEAAWVVNPETGNAYKKIRCNSWDDANIQAVAEGAHLVTINDATEQKWLSEIFGHRPYWIGLTDYATEGEWVWESGEPLTFTNWAPHEPKDDDWGDEDFVMMDFSGEWYDVGPNSVEWQMVRLAIIEKDGGTTAPSEEK